MIAGIAAVAAYITTALISGSLSPLARRPLLDGSHAAVPYNWVSPPADAAASNQPPMAVERESLALAAEGLGQSIVSTGDQQLSISLDAGAIGPLKGKKAVEVFVEPLDPAQYGVPPEGTIIRGNVYRVAMRYAPGGTPVEQIAKPGSLTMVYPTPTPELLGADHTILYSLDGQTWRPVESQNQHATQQVTARLTDIGYFAVAARQTDKAPGKDAKSFPWLIIIVVLVAAAAGTGAWLKVSRARQAKRLRQAKRDALARRSRSTKKRR